MTSYTSRVYGNIRGELIFLEDLSHEEICDVFTEWRDTEMSGDLESLSETVREMIEAVNHKCWVPAYDRQIGVFHAVSLDRKTYQSWVLTEVRE